MSTITQDQTHAVAAAAVQAMADAAAAEEAAAGLVIPAEILANANELHDMRSAIKVMEKREKVLRAAVLDFLDTAKVDAASNGIVSLSKHSSERTGIDMDKMRALYPKVLAAVETKTPVTQIRVKIKGRPVKIAR